MTKIKAIQEIEKVKQDYLNQVKKLTLEYKIFVQKIIDEDRIREITKEIK